MDHPGVAGSLLEGVTDTISVLRPGVSPTLTRSLGLGELSRRPAARS